MSLAGKWRITQMDLWDREAIDLVGPACIEFGNGHSGSFRFIAVDGWIPFEEQPNPLREPTRKAKRGMR